MSAALQMITNGGNTEGLFHGAFMESGAVIPMGDISLGQHDYDDLVRETGCDGAEDTLECLRQLPFSTFKEAMDMSPGLISYRVCHNFLDPLIALVNYVS
jgi:acetylcholinesterase